jgi:hypothetical protein
LGSYSIVRVNEKWLAYMYLVKDELVLGKKFIFHSCFPLRLVEVDLASEWIVL